MLGFDNSLTFGNLESDVTESLSLLDRDVLGNG